jgi:nitroimidazol reductase NimA-like FMN-containing flavoprotein (pyridoxamine 5'-phosphate oxidase superfamily)
LGAVVEHEEQHGFEIYTCKRSVSVGHAPVNCRACAASAVAKAGACLEQRLREQIERNQRTMPTPFSELSPMLQAFCEQAELLRLAYLDRAGYPRVVPVWFVRIEGNYYVGIGTASAKWKAIQRNARVGWVIDGGTQGSYKGASMRGRAEEVSNISWRSRVYEALGQKYFGTPEHARFIEIFGRVGDPETVYLRLVPEDGLTWEY